MAMIYFDHPFWRLFMKLNSRKRSHTKKYSGISKILMLACAAIVYSAVLSNLIDRSATELVVNAYHDVDAEQLSLVDVRRNLLKRRSFWIRNIRSCISIPRPICSPRTRCWLSVKDP